MPLPSFSRIPECIAMGSHIGPFEFDNGSNLYCWHKKKRCIDRLDVSSRGRVQSIELTELPTSFEPTSLKPHPSGQSFLLYNCSSAYIVEIDKEDEPCCSPVCTELFKEKQRLRILEGRWVPPTSWNTSSCLEAAFCLLLSDNKIRFIKCDSPGTVVDEVDFSDPDDRLDEDGLGYLSDITFDRAISMDFGKPMLSIGSGEAQKSFVARIPLFVLKHSGDIYCALLCPSMESHSLLIGPLAMTGTDENGLYWASDLICLHSDIPILAIASKGRDCRVVSHYVVFFEGELDDHELKVSQYESIELNTASTELKILKDPSFNDRYFIYTTTCVMAVDLQWSWVLSKSLRQDLVDYALRHGALETPSATRMILSVADDASRENIRHVALSRTLNLHEQTLAVSTNKRVVSVGICSETQTSRSLHDAEIGQLQADQEVLVDSVGLPVTPQILEVEKLLADLRKNSPPLSLSNSGSKGSTKCKSRLDVHKNIARLLEESKRTQVQKSAELVQNVNSNLLPRLADLKQNQARITKRLRNELAKQSELQDRLMQFAMSIDNQSPLTGSEVRIREWAKRALDDCFEKLWPQVEEVKLTLQVASGSEKEVR